ncbi:uncharacterized protein BDZ99DRAFT_512336 [Mytilinidion resinicola]|uniref:Pre-mRNA-splicing factor 38B n=1 Tax=Mytilinidion resinicola TaxID=574789 RepID=A0A6A6Y2F2_9PEZI|nr:uncharacterized protein BDZ99DRAFT_512336 [Mytilinidion resinicola]KAF2802962.1 hypothetical protein BDZ99DRAFT_512336 [Mytilinidion resinicola]
MPAEGFDDEYVVGRLKSDAAASAKKYELVGLEAYMPKSRPTMGAPKPNTRFLRNIIRETDSHNAALLAKEAEDAKNRLKALRHQKEGRLSPYVSDLRGARGDRESQRPSKRRRDDEGEDKKEHRRERRSEESGRPRDRRDRSEDRYRRHASSKDEETRNTNSRRGDRQREKGDTPASEEDEEMGESSKRSRRHDRSRDRRRRHRSRSESEDRSARNEQDSRRDLRHRRSYSPQSPSRSRSPKKSERRHNPTRSKSHKSSQTPRGPTPSERTRSASPHTKHAGRKSHSSKHRARKHQSPSVASASDPLEAIVGPAPPPPPPKVRLRGRGAFRAASAMDEHFSASYDPTADVQVNSDVEGDWDEALEAMRDRQKWKQQGADRLRAAGFTDAMVKKWENGGEKTEEDVVWAKKGEGREWDRGKVVGDDGVVDVQAEWGRLKDIY